MDEPVVWGTEKLRPKPTMSEKWSNVLIEAVIAGIAVGIVGVAFAVVALACAVAAPLSGVPFGHTWWPVGFIVALVTSVVGLIVGASCIIGAGSAKMLG